MSVTEEWQAQWNAACELLVKAYAFADTLLADKRLTQHTQQRIAYLKALLPQCRLLDVIEFPKQVQIHFDELKQLSPR